MVRSTDILYDKVRKSELAQICKCGTILRAARANFDTAAHEHFTRECAVVRNLGGQPVRPVWAHWSVASLTPKETTTAITQLFRGLRFSAPVTVPAWASVFSSAPMIEDVFISLHEELSDSMMQIWETSIHNVILRLVHNPELQPVVITLLGLLDAEPGTLAREEEVVKLLHRITLGTYG